MGEPNRVSLKSYTYVYIRANISSIVQLSKISLKNVSNMNYLVYLQDFKANTNI